MGQGQGKRREEILRGSWGAFQRANSIIYFMAKQISSLIITSQLMNFVIFLCKNLLSCFISFFKKIRWMILKLHKTTCCLGPYVIWLLRQSSDNAVTGLWIDTYLCTCWFLLCMLCTLCQISSSISSWRLGKLAQLNCSLSLFHCPVSAGTRISLL